MGWRARRKEEGGVALRVVMDERKKIKGSPRTRDGTGLERAGKSD